MADIHSKATTAEYAEGFDRIFRNHKLLMDNGGSMPTTPLPGTANPPGRENVFRETADGFRDDPLIEWVEVDGIKYAVQQEVAWEIDLLRRAVIKANAAKIVARTINQRKGRI